MLALEKSDEIFLPDDCDPRIREIYDYWLAIHPNEGLPACRDLDPLDVPRLLPYLWMCDVERNPFRFRYRLIGTAVVEVYGEELTGRYFDEYFDDFDGSATYHTLVELCTLGRPAWRRGPAVLTRKDYDIKVMERILLPFASDNVTVDLFLALSIYIKQR